MASADTTIASPDNQGAQRRQKLSEFIAESATSPGRLIDGRPYLRAEIEEKARSAIAQCEAIVACLEAGDDAGAMHGVRRFIAFSRHIGTSASWLDEANRAVVARAREASAGRATGQ